MIRAPLLTLILGVWLSLCNASYGQEKSTADGVFSKSQAEAGELVYEEACASCHDSKFYRDIWPYWQGKQLMDFYWRIVAEMPSDNPGSLSDAQYTVIIAYILSELDYPSGDHTLDPLTDMDSITIAPR